MGGVFSKGGVYNGFWISCGGIIVYRGLYFGLYDCSRLYMPDNLLFKFCVAYGVTTVAGLAAYPVDTVRRRMMMNSGSGTLKYPNAMSAFGTIARRSRVSPPSGAVTWRTSSVTSRPRP